MVPLIHRRAGIPRGWRKCVCVAALAAACIRAAAEAPAIPPPANVRATYTEKAIEIVWDSVPGVAGYHVYTGPQPRLPLFQRRRLNRQIITSGCRFAYIWDVNGEQRVRGVKGYRHHLVVTSVVFVNGVEQESGPSAEIDNYYFEGFDRADSRLNLERILVFSRGTQRTARLPVDRTSNCREAFLAFMTGPCARLQALVRDTIDPRDMGACSPLTTILVKLMSASGLRAWKAEGTFIREYHAFAIIEVDSVEYVVDIAADQFVPDVSPVVVPRDWCFLGSNGRFAQSGEPVYVVERIVPPENTMLVEGPRADLYRRLLSRAMESPAPEASGARRRAGGKKK